MSVVNIAVFVHGMIPDIDASDSAAAFVTFWEKITQFKPMLNQVFPPEQVLFVRWGHEQPTSDDMFTPDNMLTRAEQHVARRVEYSSVKKHPSANNIVMSGLFGRDYNLPGLRGILTGMREGVVQYGLADVVYYCSSDGEKQVRRVVYGQALKALRQFKDVEQVRLHVVGHSLGVTVSHDFLFGLFMRDHDPDFPKQLEKENVEDGKDYLFWRKRALNGQLTVGSYTSMASQLPLFVMRKHTLIEKFYRDEQLDLSSIGLTESGVRWQIFYDVDDVLGFASRDLYADPGNRIRQIQVNTGWKDDAHTNYTVNRRVIESTAGLLVKNSQ